MDRYTETKRRLTDALTDLSILAGDTVGPSDVTWRDVAGTAAVNLRSLAALLDAIRTGDAQHQGYPLTGPVVFPSPAEIVAAD